MSASPSAALLVRAAGPGTTIQDLGRVGWQRFGVTTAGAMDRLALQVANRLVGNPPGEAAIEFLLQGGEFVVETDSLRLAVTGADAALAIDGEPAAGWCSHRLRQGQVIRIGAARGGVYAYLAVAGGFDLPPVLGSRSTHVRSGIGGYGGRALRAGDRLPLLASTAPGGQERCLPEGERPHYRRTVRAVLGPQDDYFTGAGIDTLFGAEYEVTMQSDRMGIRLAGPGIEHAKGFNIISDGITAGCIQVPGAGAPIILMADRQSTGGYPKIATVISADLPAVAQCPPGARLRFAPVGIEEAQAARRAQDEWLRTVPARLVAAREAGGVDLERLLEANLISGVTAGDLY